MTAVLHNHHSRMAGWHRERRAGKAGVRLGEFDRLSVEPETLVSDGLDITVDRVEYEDYTETETVAYTSTVQYTNSVAKGKTR